MSERAQVELDAYFLDELAVALSDQNSFDEQYSMMDPRTGELLLWTSYGGIDGKNPIDLDELDLVRVDALPSYVWYNDMADFATRISDANAAERLSDALRGRGAFRRFKDQLHRRWPELLTPWRAFADNRARNRAVDWLLENGFTDQATADTYFEQHRDPELP